MAFPHSATVTAGDDVLATQYNDLRHDAFYHFSWGDHVYGEYLNGGFDGDTDFVYSKQYNTRSFYRFRIWPGGLFVDSHDTTSMRWLNLSSTYDDDAWLGGLIMIGTYLYTWLRKTADSTWHLVRIDPSDKSTAEMTFDGADDPDGDDANHLATDGTYVYILDNGSTKVRKFSISGTNITHDSNITLPTAADGINFGCNGTHFYYEDSVDANNKIMVKTDLSGNLIRQTTYRGSRNDLYGFGFIHNIYYCLYEKRDSGGDRIYSIYPFYY